MHFPDWVRAGRALPARARGCGDARVAAIALVGSTLVGIALGTLLTIHFLPLAGADPALRRGLARSADHRDDLHHLLRAARA